MNLRRFFPQSLFFRLALLLFSAFFILHTVTILTVADFFERHVVRILLADHSASIALHVRLLEEEQAEGRAALLESLSKLPELSIWLAANKPEIQPGEDALSRFFLTHLKNALADAAGPGGSPREVLAQVRVFSSGEGATRWAAFVERFFALWDVSGFFQTHLAIQLADGSWLNIEYVGHNYQAHLRDVPFLVIALEFFVLAALSLFMVHKLVLPLRTLAGAAEEFGASARISYAVPVVPPIPEAGPIEVRHAAQAFNTMRERICAVMEERERVFAALAHDLRTPITRMRLRVEKADPESLREKLREDVRGLQSIVEMSMAFIQSERHAETLMRVDMQAFLEAIVEDRRDMGENITLLGGELRLSALIFPVALRRCLENLLDNAVRYGKVATVSASLCGGEAPALCIDIEDSGPGIEEKLLEKVFEPFFRIEHSRNRHTGGHGLGLSIARRMAQLHNASLRLCNKPEGGLRVRLELPLV